VPSVQCHQDAPALRLLGWYCHVATDAGLCVHGPDCSCVFDCFEVRIVV